MLRFRHRTGRRGPREGGEQQGRAHGLQDRDTGQSLRSAVRRGPG